MDILDNISKDIVKFLKQKYPNHDLMLKNAHLFGFPTISLNGTHVIFISQTAINIFKPKNALYDSIDIANPECYNIVAEKLIQHI